MNFFWDMEDGILLTIKNLKVVKNLNVVTVHGWDNLMLKSCSKSINLPVKLVFKTMLYE